MAAWLSQFGSYQKILYEIKPSEPRTAHKQSNPLRKIILVFDMTIIIVLIVLVVDIFSDSVRLDKDTHDSKRDQVVDEGCE